mmetsp:Transcript_3748/g.10167  ORF Transcript_3748/g.10167 Transcript_3748/m.10167 type:complete len:157 (-) Transcript_3748:6142-6612(-)
MVGASPKQECAEQPAKQAGGSSQRPETRWLAVHLLLIHCTRPVRCLPSFLGHSLPECILVLCHVDTSTSASLGLQPWWSSLASIFVSQNHIAVWHKIMRAHADSEPSLCPSLQQGLQGTDHLLASQASSLDLMQKGGGFNCEVDNVFCNPSPRRER